MPTRLPILALIGFLTGLHHTHPARASSFERCDMVSRVDSVTPLAVRSHDGSSQLKVDVFVVDSNGSPSSCLALGPSRGVTVQFREPALGRR